MMRGSDHVYADRDILIAVDDAHVLAAGDARVYAYNRSRAVSLSPTAHVTAFGRAWSVGASVTAYAQALAWRAESRCTD